jgi:hypothetical protein
MDKTRGVWQMKNINKKRSDIHSQVLGTQTMHIHFIYEKEYFHGMSHGPNSHVLFL